MSTESATKTSVPTPVLPPVILVTGDLVLDCHLYGGVKTAATDFSEPGTTFDERPGGAALTHALLVASADARGRLWDLAKEKWETENKFRQKIGEAPLPLPKDLAKPRPVPTFESSFSFATANLSTSLPGHLRSYGVWTRYPARKGSKDQVWRIEHHFGYGSTVAAKPENVFTPNSLQPAQPPSLTLIDDGGILFRHGSASMAWPDYSKDGSYYLLKMSRPLVRGDLWAAMAAVRKRLLVVVSAADLRREDTQISERLSWEQTAEDTLRVLQQEPVASELLLAAHVIVNFGCEGCLWVRRGADGQIIARLVFAPDKQENDYRREFEGSAYGFQTCFAAGIAHWLMQVHAAAKGLEKLSPFTDETAMDATIQRGIVAGLVARRRLEELGHGAVGAKHPGLQTDVLGVEIAEAGKPHGGFVCVTLPAQSCQPPACQWSVLAESEFPAVSPVPLIGLGHLTARFGTDALSHLPALHLGGLFTVDRNEIESLRTLDALIRAYEAVDVQKKPLSLGVFGPPGAGKSFGVKALAKAILGPDVPFLEFNLSQFKNPEELIGALHRVRDAVLGGTTPVAFWDEFDSQQYKWLQFLLAPMQDGAFQEGQITHPIGKCVFIFAGGTSPTLEEFGIAEPKQPTDKELEKLSQEDRAIRRHEFREQAAQYREYRLLKGPDFVSRLHGFLNVLGPNPRNTPACADFTWPVRRALLLRALLGIKGSEELSIDAGLLQALLVVPNYRHGARSFEKIVVALAHGRNSGRILRSDLPPDTLLNRETDGVEFRRLMSERDDFKNHPDIEALAAAVHQSFLAAAERSQLEAQISQQPHKAWTIHPAVQMTYDQLDADAKASNRAAARRIPDHLALINFVVQRQTEGDNGAWMDQLKTAIERHIERLAQAEHLGWCAERIANGWTYAATRDNTLKFHPLLVPWAKLSPSDQDKDRSSARSIPGLLEVAKFKAVPVSAATKTPA